MKKAPKFWKEANSLQKIGFVIGLIMGINGIIVLWRQQTSFAINNTQLSLFVLMIICFVLARIPRISNWLAGSKKVIESIQPRIHNLEKEMKKIDAMENKVEAIVQLFQVISPIQDAGGFSQEIFKLKKHNRNGKLNDQIKALGVLQAHFRNAGRSEFGINRTAQGEEVTTEKVFLGNVFGLWTKTAAYWLSERTNLEKLLRPDVSRDQKNPVTCWWMIHDYQCGGFVKSHTEGILEQIKVLKAVA